MGAACVASAGGAYALKPRREVLLLPASEQLEDIVPMTMPGWTSENVGDPLALNQEGSLSARLYNQVVTRVYAQPATGVQIMALLAYGAKQNDDLQLHRPEVCYPAFGFDLRQNRADQLPLSDDVKLPVRRLVAVGEDSSQYVTYWSRLGEYLPQSGSEQRDARFQSAFRGIVPDGILCRFSAWGDSPEAGWRATDELVRALLTAIKSPRRAVLIGSARAAALASTSGKSAPA